jgi:hypothetical protein
MSDTTKESINPQGIAGRESRERASNNAGNGYGGADDIDLLIQALMSNSGQVFHNGPISAQSEPPDDVFEDDFADQQPKSTDPFRRDLYQHFERVKEWERGGCIGERPTAPKPSDYPPIRLAIDPDLEMMNSRHAVLPLGGMKATTLVATWGDDPDFPGRQTIFRAQSFQDFKNLHSNKRKTVTVKDEDDKPTTKRVPIGAWWLNQTQRRQYDGGRRFMPQYEKEVVGDTLNMFEGFAVQARKPEGRSGESGCQKFLDHGFKIMCSGNEEHWDYLLKREAWIIQNRQRCEIAAVYRTIDEGSGKGFWCNHLGHLYGAARAPRRISACTQVWRSERESLAVPAGRPSAPRHSDTAQPRGVILNRGTTCCSTRLNTSSVRVAWVAYEQGFVGAKLQGFYKR